jgi:hypothetical protein
MRKLRDVGTVIVIASLALWCIFCITINILIQVIKGDGRAMRQVPRSNQGSTVHPDQGEVLASDLLHRGSCARGLAGPTPCDDPTDHQERRTVPVLRANLL